MWVFNCVEGIAFHSAFLLSLRPSVPWDQFPIICLKPYLPVEEEEVAGIATPTDHTPARGGGESIPQ